MKPKTKERVLFCQFLKQNNCVKQFVKGYTDGRDTKLYSLKDFFKDEHSDSFLTGAFTWSETEEKHDYWSGLNIKWIEYPNLIN